MADPFTIVQVISASASLVVQCTRVAKALHDMAGKYKMAEISIISTAHELDIIRLAWERIENVLQSWETLDVTDHGLVNELRLKLDFGRVVVSSLADDIDALKKRPLGFWQRSKYVWDEANFKSHQDRIRGQVAAMTLLVSILNLPTSLARTDMLYKGASVLLESDESALSIAPSRFSSRIPSMFSDSSPDGLESPALAYHQLSFDDELFTARVYKRNYRHSLMFFKTEEPEQNQARTPSTESLRDTGLAQQTPLLDETQHHDDAPNPILSAASEEMSENRQAPYAVESGLYYAKSSQITNPELATASHVAELDETASSQIIEPGVPKHMSDIFKSFRVSMVDTCRKVLPAALLKYNIETDWREYALYIVYGDLERCLGLEEKPLLVFKQLHQEGKKPMFMLRRHLAPIVT